MEKRKKVDRQLYTDQKEIRVRTLLKRKRAVFQYAKRAKRNDSSEV
jgi:hypothetical protein